MLADHQEPAAARDMSNSRKREKATQSPHLVLWLLLHMTPMILNLSMKVAKTLELLDLGEGINQFASHSLV